MAAAAAVASGATAASYSEEAVKAAYLHRFAAYVEWPADALPEDSFNIGVFGSDAVVSQLQRLLPTLSIHGRPARVRPVAGPADLANVSILYVGPGKAKAGRALIAAAKERRVLVVTDDENGLRAGAIINFVQIDRHVRFEVSQPAADRSGIKVDAALLAVAARVEER